MEQPAYPQLLATSPQKQAGYAFRCSLHHTLAGLRLAYATLQGDGGGRGAWSARTLQGGPIT